MLDTMPMGDDLHHMDAVRPLLGRSEQELESLVESLGYPRFRGRQLAGWIYRHVVRSLDEATNLPRALRDAVARHAPFGAIPPAHTNYSDDDTRKHLFPTLHGGFVEAAVIPEGERTTLCLSTQVGCRRGCTFCQTARQGFQGNLTTTEILNQYHSLPERPSVTNIVYMGMGEPLDNERATLASLERFCADDGYRFPRRRITVSTVGIHPALQRFLDSEAARRVSLAVSLHTPFPEERRAIMPVEVANPIEETVRLIRTRREDRARRVSFEYTLFGGRNDTPRHVDGIARLLNGLAVRINLIHFHELDGTPLQRASDEVMQRFAEQLRAKGFRTSVRRSRGQDINAACGMLWTRHAAAPQTGLRNPTAASAAESVQTD